MKIQTRQHRPLQQAFTLVEMLLVLVIIGTLAAIVVPKVVGRGDDARRKSAAAQIANFSTALDAFEIDNGYFPRGSEGMNELVEAPRDAQNWKGPYLPKIPMDPWGIPYMYEYPGRNSANSYDLSSAGPDKQPGNEDDITSWSTGPER